MSDNLLLFLLSQYGTHSQIHVDKIRNIKQDPMINRLLLKTSKPSSIKYLVVHTEKLNTVITNVQ